MKKIILKPLAAMAFIAFTMTGCASSNDTADDATAMEAATETEVMAETTDAAPMADNATPTPYDFDIIVMPDPSDTFESIFTNTKDPVEYDNMFEDVDETENYDALALMKTNPNLSTFVRLIEITNLEDDLNRIEGFTIFAPTNAAFAKIPKAKLEMLLMPGNKATLSRVLQAHVLPSQVYASNLTENSIIELTADRHIPIEVTMGGSVIKVGGSTIIMPNVEAKNAMIHVVDNVIVPSEDAVQDAFGIY